MKESSNINEMIHRKLELSETFKKCESIMNMERLMTIKEYNARNKNLLEKYYNDDDMTNKQSNEVINKKIKNIFNLNNYEQNIKRIAWQKDLSKMYLGLNDENGGKNENGFFDYNFNKRNKKKESLIFIKNFFGKMKSVKKFKNLFNKRNTNVKTYQKIMFNNNDNKKYLDKKKETKKEKEEEINKIWDKIKIKYNSSFKDINGKELHNNYIKFYTEINNFKKKNLFQTKSPTYTNNKNTKINKFFFPKIATSKSTRGIFKTKNKGNKSISRNKRYKEKLKNIYEGNNKYKYMTLNSESNKNSLKNLDMPELLKDKKVQLFKKNNKIFLSPLHFSKYVQMNDIKNSLIKEGFLDKDVFKICNKNI